MGNTYFITEACVGCTLCARSCPVKAISGALKARHEIDPARCVRCGLCGRLCAKGAVLSPAGAPCARIPKKEWPRPVVDGESCAGCSVCVEVCPKGVLSLTEPRFHGDTHTVAALARPEDCIGCSLCAEACPIGAIGMKAPESGEKT